MTDELDVNAIAAEFLKHNLDKLLEGAKGIFKEARDKIRLQLDQTYQEYLTNVLGRYSKTKSFLLRGESVSLYQFYEPLNLQTQHGSLTQVGINDVLRLGPSIILTGSAGCGKSMLVRHLLLDALLSKTRVPIFVELRQFNSFQGNLLELIISTLGTYKFLLDEAYIKKAIDMGHFLLILDGYDEVAHASRPRVRTTILEFVKSYPKNAMILTSRPDPELEGWQSFALARVAPLDVNQAYSLIEKLPFNEEIKVRFLEDLRKDLFRQHESFLSNPLLLSIMLLSYGQSASIPNKLSVFYNQAYEALFERHDVLKEGFKRQILSQLDIQDFGRLFSAFCLQAYDRNKLEFSHVEALQYIQSSQKIVGIPCNKDDYLSDLIQAVCLLVQDGLQIVYAHRSFQEYFTARFICEARSDIQEQLLKKYEISIRRDTVFPMLYEMRPELIQRHFILPKLDELFELLGVKRTVAFSHYEKFMRTFFSGVHIVQKHTGLIPTHQRGMALLEAAIFTLDHCGHLVGWSPNQFEEPDVFADKWQKILTDDPNIQPDEHQAHMSYTVQFNDKSYGRKLLRDLEASGGYISLESLKKLAAIKTVLTQTLQKEQKTLEGILRRRAH